jgi:hypothetical protein
MSIGDLFWLFFIFTALQPVLRQRMLDAMRSRKIAQLEAKRGSRVILLVHPRLASPSMSEKATFQFSSISGPPSADLVRRWRRCSNRQRRRLSQMCGWRKWRRTQIRSLPDASASTASPRCCGSPRARSRERLGLAMPLQQLIGWKRENTKDATSA